MGKRQVNPFEKQELKRSICPVSCVLDILGDKWTLLVVRDMFMGKKTYGELQKSPEKIPTNILAERLKRLERSDVMVGSTLMWLPDLLQDYPALQSYAQGLKERPAYQRATTE